MSVTLHLNDGEARQLAQLAVAVRDLRGHRPLKCPICELSKAVLAALARAGVEAG